MGQSGKYWIESIVLDGNLRHGKDSITLGNKQVTNLFFLAIIALLWLKYTHLPD
jgi:hypothetical protein